MATLVEMALEMVMARARSTSLTADEMVTDLKRFHLELKSLGIDAVGEVTKQEQAQEQDCDEVPLRPAISVKEAFKKNAIACMVCGKGGFKYLTKHLRSAHKLEPKQYRDMFGIPPKQSLTARSYSEASREKSMTLRGASAETMIKTKAANKKSPASRKNPMDTVRSKTGSIGTARPIVSLAELTPDNIAEGTIAADLAPGKIKPATKRGRKPATIVPAAE